LDQWYVASGYGDHVDMPQRIGIDSVMVDARWVIESDNSSVTWEFK